MGRGLGLLGMMLLASCAKPMTPAQQKLEEDRAVAQVEATERALPPLRPVVLQPITHELLTGDAAADRRGCTFLSGNRAIALTLGTRAEVRADGAPLVFTADAGGTRLPGGAWTHYVGKTHALALTQNGQDARLVVMDPYNRPVFSAAGALRCPAT